MKKYGVLVLGLIACAAVLMPQSKVLSQKRAAAGRAYEANQILVKLKTAARRAVASEQLGRGRVQLAADLLADHGVGAEAIDTFDAREDRSLYVVEFDDAITVEEAMTRARQDPRVEYAEPNFKIEAAETMPNDSRFDQMWALRNPVKSGADINATRAWDLSTGSSEVVVAITDTGIDIGHPDLAANIWVNADEIPGNGVDDDNNGLVDDVNGWNFSDGSREVFSNPDTDRHGTFVAGIIGAVGNNGTGVTGVAWRVRLMPLKFIGGATSNTAGAIKAINYAIAQKKKGVNVRAINASWGPSRADCADSFSQSLKDVITQAGTRGILFVSSAGNGICGNNTFGDNLDISPEYPAAWSGEIPTMISVAAVDQNDIFPYWSNYGPNNVGVAAPGAGVLSTVPRGFGGLPPEFSYISGDGTSFAAPHVTGIAALLAASEPNLTPEQVKKRIIDTAEPIPPLAAKVKASGRANAYNALANHFAAVPPVVVTEVVFTKKIIYVNGLGFTTGAMSVEVNGLPVSGKTRYDAAFALANGSLTQINVKMGKLPIQETFPQNLPVNVTVVNQTTGERSAPLSVTRR